MFKRILWSVLLVLPSLVLAQTATKAPSAKMRALKVPAAEALPLTELSAEHLLVAQKVLVGAIPCELSNTVAIAPHAESPGRFLLTIGRQQHVMEPVLTSTGAVRLENAASGMVWLQLTNKSMLMDHKQGKRVADGCMTPGQQLVAEAMERTPPPGLLDPVVVAQPADEVKPQAGPQTVVTATK
ncbi:hypothetical protein [Rhodoferax saidenbachensis]|uniref:Uncharacterized protein n=1 Tax=Rhodoferax saidenbachensis TaxID=1484693 RepID=A0A1P8K880_9BURK|nr:hypothetical protein [Rhodoferax saidenbachensis]APW42199.1 hypothetical protein RS694_06400 [Rhodoferax saidenbachensis]